MSKQNLLWVLSIYLLLSASLSAVSFIIPREPLSMDVGDIDLDGNYDVAIGHEGVAVPGHTYPAITLLKNFQNNSFAFIDSSYAYPGYIGAIHFSDMNNDQYPELSILYGENIGSTGYAYIRIYHNNGGSYTSPSDYTITTSISYFDFVLSDINGDGYEDPVCISNSGHLWSSLFNYGNYNFSTSTTTHLSFPPQAVTSGDLTGDGIDDILISGQPLTMFSYTDNSWTTAVIDSFTFISDSVICDMDSDGENEIVTYQIPPAGDDCVLRIYDKQNGQFTIAYEHIYSFVSSLAVFDYNNDNLPDLLLFNKLITNLGNYTFSEPSILPFATAGNKNVFADMDHNGFLDILSFITAYPANITRFYIYFNDGNGNFIPDPIVESSDHYNPVPQITLNCYPNPCKDFVRNSFTLPKDCSNAKLQVFNVKGEVVREINITKYLSFVDWDGKDSRQRAATPGMYFIRLVSTNIQTRCQKIIKLK